MSADSVPPAPFDISSPNNAWTAIRATAAVLVREATLRRDPAHLPGALKTLMAATATLGVDLAFRSPADVEPGMALTEAQAKAQSDFCLSRRELQVLLGMAEGGSNAVIAQRLHIGEDTVKTHARRMFRKVGARDRAHAVSIGFRSGLLT